MSILSRMLGREHRDSYTSDVLAIAQQRVTSTAHVAAVGALEHASDLIARGLSVAEVSGDAGLLTPSVLQQIGRSLIRNGESYHALQAEADGTLRLVESEHVTVQGGHSPASWRYTVTLPGPSVTSTMTLPAGSVLAVRRGVDPRRPWAGRSPLAVANQTGELAARLENALQDESSIPTLRAYPTPTGYPETLVQRALATLTTRRAIGVLETVRQGGGAGQSSAPLKDWSAVEQGPKHLPGNVELYGMTFAVVSAVCGVPPPLGPMAGSNSGMLVRESVRILGTHTIEPIARLVAEAASMLLEQPVSIKLHRLSNSDPRARAQTLKLLMDAPVGMPKDEAMRLVGY